MRTLLRILGFILPIALQSCTPVFAQIKSQNRPNTTEEKPSPVEKAKREVTKISPQKA